MSIKNKGRILLLSLLFFTLLPLRTLAHNPDVRESGEGSLLQQYTWWEIMNPLLLASLIVVYLLYLRIIRKVPSAQTSEFPFRKKIWFLYGLVTIYVSLAGPVAILANNLLLSAHMLQQSLMYIVMPPLILLGMPEGFYRVVDEKMAKLGVFRKLTSPLIILVLFNMVWSFYHIPLIYEFFLEQVILLEILHVVLNTTAFFMWIHVLAPIGKVNNMSYMVKVGYMFANGMLITPACALIIFAGSVVYPSLIEAPQIFPWLPPIDDQQLGGIIMKIVQEVSYGMVISYLFFKWAKVERAKDAEVDALPPSAVE